MYPVCIYILSCIYIYKIYSTMYIYKYNIVTWDHYPIWRVEHKHMNGKNTSRDMTVLYYIYILHDIA